MLTSSVSVIGVLSRLFSVGICCHGYVLSLSYVISSAMGDSNSSSRTSSILFGIRSQSKAMQELQRVRQQNKRFTLIAAAAIFMLILALICLVILDLYTSASIISKQNRTQSLTEQKIEHLGELIRTQQWKLVQDIELEPEEADKRWDAIVDDPVVEENTEASADKAEEKKDVFEEGKPEVVYPNHRYSDEKPMVQRIGWQPRPFSFQMDAVQPKGPVNSIQDVLAQHPTLNPLPPPGFTQPVRFRGVYLHPRSEDDVTEAPKPAPAEVRDYEYYRKINDYFANQSSTDNMPVPYVGREEYIMDSYNFLPQTTQPELHTKAIYHPYAKPEQSIPIRKNWNKQKRRPKKKPFTVMLDIYPMGREEDMEASAMRSAVSKVKPSIYIPLRPGERYFPPDAEIPYIPQFITPPRQRRRERMVMKLNLFPKNAERRQRRTFNIFGKKEDDDGCEGVVGHNPYGKPIVAKWKNKKGEVIHAKLVSLNQWRRINKDMDPR